MKLMVFILVLAVVAVASYQFGVRNRRGILYVGPYSQQAYIAAHMIKDGGNGTPYNIEIIKAGREILAKQKEVQ